MHKIKVFYFINISHCFRLIKKQLCYMLARQYVPLELEDEDLRTILLNAHINDHFLSLAREVKSTSLIL